MTTHSTNAFITGKSVGDLVKELKPQPDLVDVPSTETLETVFDILLANDILSVPVYKDGSHPKIYLGFVSALDLVQLIVDKVTSCASNIVGIFGWPMHIHNSAAEDRGKPTVPKRFLTPAHLHGAGESERRSRDVRQSYRPTISFTRPAVA